MSNFDKYKDIEKVDCHMHYNIDRSALLEAAEDDNFRFVSINTDIYFFPSIAEQENVIHNQRKTFGNRLDYICTFEAKGFDEPNWAQKSIDTIKRSIDKGAVAVKIWKNIGMELKDLNDNLVMVDDARLDPILQYLEDNNIRLTGHLGEPRNCWLPLDEMTVKQDSEYFKEHPEYHMYLQPEFPSYEEQIEARDNMLRKHKGIIFNGAHFASLEWNVDEIAKRLDEFPEMMVDTAERICHLQYQSLTDYDRVRDFVLKYQDRIMYGTDIIDDNSMSDAEIITHQKKRWAMHWKYFTTDEMMTAPKVASEFRALNLPWEAVEKIYYKNAVKFYDLKKISVSALA